jgi:integrase
MESSEACESLRRLDASVKLAPDTRKNYIFAVKHYCDFIEKTPDEVVRHARSSPRRFEDSFIEFIQEKGRDSSPSTLAFHRDSLRRFLEVNRVGVVDWKHISEFLPRQKKSGQDRAPTAEEVRRILDVASLRMKCLVLYLCSSGARIGSLAYLRWRDVQEVEVEGLKLARVTIYRGEQEEYTTFVTPECYRYLLEYKGLRERLGEKLTDASFVFASDPNKRDFDPVKVRPIAVTTWKNMLRELLTQLDVRATIREGRYPGYEFKQAHGYRKFFKTRMEVAGVKPIITELLMGHGIGVASSYMKPSTEELLAEYAKGIPTLTILSRERDKADLKGEMKNQLLLVAGFKDEEIEKMDLSRTSEEEFQKTVREKLLGMMTNSGHKQKVIPVSELKAHISQGWEYVAQLPDSEAVVKLPS